MFFLSCGALSRPFSLVFVKTLPKEERPSRKRKKEEYNKKRRERSGEIVKGMSSIYRKILGYYSTIHLPFYPYFTISSTHTITPTHTITSTLTPTHTITSTLTPTHTITVHKSLCDILHLLYCGLFFHCKDILKYFFGMPHRLL
jgi:hypothetical protein